MRGPAVRAARFSVSEFSAGDKGLYVKPETGADCMF